MKLFVLRPAFLLASLLILDGCKSAPTKLKEEVGGAADNTVLADTRSAFEFSTYHVSGSVSLNSEDFLILKNANDKSRKLDPDTDQIIERLARRGISPLKKVVLIAAKKDSPEAKKWEWLLRKLNVINLETTSLNDYIKNNKPLRPKPDPERTDVWMVENAPKLLEKSDACFVNWSETCLN
ncbi:MAG: rhodanese-like domain-containing protein [Pseudobdellovibrio sp.]